MMAVADPLSTAGLAESALGQLFAEGLFDAAWYRATQLRDEYCVDPLSHYLECGFRRGLWPSPLFNPQFYALSFPEIDFTRINPLIHYRETAPEMRADTHVLFNRRFYRDAGEPLPSGLDPLEHYLTMREALLRPPHPLFDSVYYYETNPDIAADCVHPLQHFLLYGYRERRSPHPLFDPTWYLEQRTDVGASANWLVHYLRIGARQGSSPNPLFDSKWYLWQTDDSEAAMNPLLHYLRVGSAAGLTPHPLFDPSWYRATQMPTEDAEMEPLTHFFAKGLARGYDPNPLFSTPWYHARYPDVVGGQKIGIIHYIWHGAAELRDPHPAFHTKQYMQDNPDCSLQQQIPLVHALQRHRRSPVRDRRSVTLRRPPPVDLSSAATIGDLDTVPVAQRRLAERLVMNVDAAAVVRIVSYFSIIERLELAFAATSLSRDEKLQFLTQYIATRAEKLNDARPVIASVIIPVYNKVEYTIAAVISLLEHQCRTRYEVIIGNDISGDETRSVFEAVGGIVGCITHAVNGGFTRNCNMSVRAARGQYVVLLNNDTIIIDGWLDELLAPFTRFNDVGLVGSKLLNADGSLQEAGAIIWQDGMGWNFGRDQPPHLPEYNYLKDVDYVSGASIAISKALWDALGGFDDRYSPAYYEDSDLAFAVRARGLRTLYAPGSMVIHHEGISHGTDTGSGIKAYQLRNQAFFVEKWKAQLEDEQFASGNHVFLARDRSRRRRHVLVVDHYIPQFDRDAGSRAIFHYLRLLVDAGLQVTFWPDNLYYDRAYVGKLQELGIEVLYGGEYVGQFPRWIADNGRYIDYYVLSRVHIAESYVDSIRGNSAGSIIFYAHDLNSARLKMQYAVTRNEKLLHEITYWEEAEERVWRAADVLYYPSEEETRMVAARTPGKLVRTMPLFTYSRAELDAERARVEVMDGAPAASPSLLFVAGFRHPPNVDAAQWLVNEVLPRVRGRLPNVHILIVGSFPPPEVLALASEEVTVTGYVSDPLLYRLYRSSSIVVAPLRFGGGVKGKVLEGLRFGIPVVTTQAGAQGMVGAADYLEVADTPAEFAAGILKLVADPALCRRRVLRGLDYLEAV